MNLGMPEMLFVFFLALLIFGPKKLPEISRQIGRALGEFKSVTDGLKAQLEGEVRKLEADTHSLAQPAIREQQLGPGVTPGVCASTAVVPPESSEPATQAADSHLATEAGSAISAIISRVLSDPTGMDAAAAELAVAVNRPETESASVLETLIATASTDIPSEATEVGLPVLRT